MNGLFLLLLASSLPSPFEENGRWGYRDAAGATVIAPRYEQALDFSREGIAAVVDARGWAYIDVAGRVLVRPLVVDNGPDEFQQGLARLSRGGKVGFFDTRGRMVIPPAWKWAAPFSEDRAAVCEGCVEVAEGEHRAVRGGKWGFIDRRGAVAVPLAYEEVRPFENGRARVRKGGAWIEIDPSGKTLTGS
jgi:hypothetical protein